MNIQQLIESKYPTSELPDYNRGEEWTFNGFKLIQTGRAKGRPKLRV